jgi:hypothetical protein
LSLKGGELKADRSVLHRGGHMTSEQKSHETVEEHDEGRHEPRFLAYILMKVKLLRADGVLPKYNSK